MLLPRRALHLAAAAVILAMLVAACGRSVAPEPTATASAGEQTGAAVTATASPLPTEAAEAATGAQPAAGKLGEAGAEQAVPVPALPPQVQPGQVDALPDEPHEPQAGRDDTPQDQPAGPEPGRDGAPRDQPVEPQAGGPIDLVGIWVSDDMTAYGRVRTEMILQRNGHYSYQAVWNDLMSWEVGRYEAGEGFIHFSLEDYGPTSYKGTDLQRPLSWTVFYTVVDANTMIWEDRILGTQWTVRRQ